MSKNLFIKSYGCQMNVYDTERMIDLVKPLDYKLTNDLIDADLVILNTCHVREKAAEKVYSEIGRIKKIKKNNKYKLIIAGCVAQAEGLEIKSRSPTVDAIVGTQSYHLLPEIISKLNKKRSTIIEDDFTSDKKFNNLDFEQTTRTTAFVTIQEGCDKFCTFCVVPYTRGSEFSRPINDILHEIKKYASSGVKEITLLGQNVNAYHGVDEKNVERRLDYLINKISEIDSIKRIRYMTSHPIDMDQNLINCHKIKEKLMPFLHLPIQSGSNYV